MPNETLQNQIKIEFNISIYYNNNNNNNYEEKVFVLICNEFRIKKVKKIGCEFVDEINNWVVIEIIQNEKDIEEHINKHRGFSFNFN